MALALLALTVYSFRSKLGGPVPTTAFAQIAGKAARGAMTIPVVAVSARAEDDAVQAAQRSPDVSTYQYRAGAASYLQVITAETVALQDQVAAVNIFTRRRVSSFLLIEALGGGWDVSTLPSAPDLEHGK